jgi:segregation and condensation protein B
MEPLDSKELPSEAAGEEFIPATEEAPTVDSAPAAIPDEDGIAHDVVADVDPPDPAITDDDAAAASDALTAQLLVDSIESAVADEDGSRHMAVLEALVYVTDEPLSAEQIAKALGEPLDQVQIWLDRLVEEFNKPEHGLTVKEVAGGYKMATKPEHHESVRTFVKNLNPPLKLSLAALETLAVIAYKQPITAPEIMEIRGVQGAGVLKTLIDRKLITTAGRKNVVGKPILYKTTKEFLVQFGLRDLNELPTLKEFEDLRRLAFAEADETEQAPSSDELVRDREPAEQVDEPTPEQEP